VTIENKAGALKLVNHLIDFHGFRNIGFLSGPADHEDSYWREMGYRESLSSHGFRINPNLIAFGGFNAVNAQDSVERWLKSGIEFDAIFAGDDDAATGAITAIRLAGKRVPEDIAVVGFDDIYISQYSPIDDHSRTYRTRWVYSCTTIDPSHSSRTRRSTGIIAHYIDHPPILWMYRIVK
jgi:DNA-binding LacI/PurR family transcriptional regulator